MPLGFLHHSDGSSIDNNASELTQALQDIGAICVRLESLASRLSGSRSPIIAVAGRRAVTLITDVYQMMTEIRAAIGHAIGRDGIHVKSLSSVWRRLHETLYLLILCGQCETDVDGDDGALTAAYATIMMEEQPSYDPLHHAMKRHRFMKILVEAMSAWFGPEATSKNWSWGLPGVHPPSAETIAKDIWHVHQSPLLLCSWAHALSMLSRDS